MRRDHAQRGTRKILGERFERGIEHGASGRRAAQALQGRAHAADSRGRIAGCRHGFIDAGPVPRLEDADPRGGALQLEPDRVGVRLGLQRFRARGLELGGDDVAVVGFAFEMRFRDFAREHQIRPHAFERRDLRTRFREAGRAGVSFLPCRGGDALGFRQRLNRLEPCRFGLGKPLLAFAQRHFCLRLEFRQRASRVNRRRVGFRQALLEIGPCLVHQRRRGVEIRLGAVEIRLGARANRRQFLGGRVLSSCARVHVHAASVCSAATSHSFSTMASKAGSFSSRPSVRSSAARRTFTVLRSESSS